MTSAEVAAVFSNSHLCVTATGILWFAQKMVESGFTAGQTSSSLVSTVGHSDRERCFHLLGAVEAQVAANPAQFHTIVGILSSEPALMSYADAITKSYGRLKCSCAVDSTLTVILVYGHGETCPCGLR